MPRPETHEYGVQSLGVRVAGASGRTGTPGTAAHGGSRGRRFSPAAVAPVGQASADAELCIERTALCAGLNCSWKL